MANIKLAMNLLAGDKVHCPADRGDAAFIGTVTVPPTGQTKENIHGTPYTWVSVADQTGRKSVWPSNRLNIPFTR